MKQLIYLVAVALVLLLVAFALEHFGALGDVDVGLGGRALQACHAVACETANLAGSSAAPGLSGS